MKTQKVNMLSVVAGFVFRSNSIKQKKEKKNKKKKKKKQSKRVEAIPRSFQRRLFNEQTSQFPYGSWL